ncbi:MAG: RHS repeat-associated core domain-containing protein, partial [Methylacidiphilales bacterium]|nr:RHS repeat-associated core domain-containing protein [Candidatus Methylacidiphilales bacterium]
VNNVNASKTQSRTYDPVGNRATHTDYLQEDILGSTARLIDLQGTEIHRARYAVYGEAYFADGSTANNFTSYNASHTRFWFTGREMLGNRNDGTGSGLYDYRNRIYSTTLGRFMQPDPIGFDAEDVNWYRYVGNSPVNYIDPIGNCISVTEFNKTLDILIDGYNDLKKEIVKNNIKGKDKYYHCMTACRAAREGNKSFAETLLKLREIGDLLKNRAEQLMAKVGCNPRLPSGKPKEVANNIEAARDSLDDMNANYSGLNCPKDKTCDCCCKDYQ